MSLDPKTMDCPVVEDGMVLVTVTNTINPYVCMSWHIAAAQVGIGIGGTNKENEWGRSGMDGVLSMQGMRGVKRIISNAS